jgi:plastocyanin
MRAFFAAILVAFSVVASACGGSTDAAVTPTTPTPAPPATPRPAPASTVVTIDVIGINGSQSFSPNPATVRPGQTVVWRNVDSVRHRMVLNTGSLDTGDLAAGASSQPIAINAGGGYHCSIHPSMVGTIAQ